MEMQQDPKEPVLLMAFMIMLHAKLYLLTFNNHYLFSCVVFYLVCFEVYLVLIG